MSAGAGAFGSAKSLGAAAIGAAPAVQAAKLGEVINGPIMPVTNAPVTDTVGEGRSQWSMFIESLREHRAAWVSLWVLLAVAASCIVLPAVLPWDATELDYKVLDATAPSAAHPLGTDTLGRDVLARLVSAGRISLLIGLMVALFSASTGALVGISAGYFGGKIDEALMWVVNVLMTIPPFVLLLALASVSASDSGPASKVLQSVPPVWRIILIMSLLGWMAISRVVRSQVISLRKQEFVEAAIALGGSHQRVMIVHILPNIVSVLAVFTTLTVSTAIMTESGLSFLGVGVMPPTATWGNMLLEARDVFSAISYWWLTWFPALAILLTVLCVNFIGDGMRDAFDPRGRGR
jgi:ABC-type dipeptide/oligopeptide/nickel transport system permease subunit